MPGTLSMLEVVFGHGHEHSATGVKFPSRPGSATTEAMTLVRLGRAQLQRLGDGEGSGDGGVPLPGRP